MLWLVWALIFGTYAAVDFFVGGDADHGFERDGKYYLAGRGGRYTETSQGFYYYSRTHGMIVDFAAIPLAVVSFSWYFFSTVKSVAPEKTKPNQSPKPTPGAVH